MRGIEDRIITKDPLTKVSQKPFLHLSYQKKYLVLLGFYILLTIITIFCIKNTKKSKVHLRLFGYSGMQN